MKFVEVTEMNGLTYTVVEKGFFRKRLYVPNFGENGVYEMRFYTRKQLMKELRHGQTTA